VRAYIVHCDFVIFSTLALLHPNDEFIKKQCMLVYSYLLSLIHTVTESPRGVPRAIHSLQGFRHSKKVEKHWFTVTAQHGGHETIVPPLKVIVLVNGY